MTKVSIITPLFNRAHIINQTAQSVINQTHKDWEWIIVDDGSSDGGPDIIQNWATSDPRIKFYLRNREPKGACTCRNIGWAESTGEYLIFLDSDDLLTHHCLKHRLQCQSKGDSKTDIVQYFQTAIIGDNPKTGHIWDDQNHPVEWLEGLLGMVPPCQSTGPLWPRKIWNKVGGWREDLNVWQDIELHLRAHFRGIVFLASQSQEVDFLHRVSSDSISRVGFHSKEKLASRMKVVRYVLENREFIVSENQRMAMAGMVLSLIRNLSLHQNWSEADKLLNKAKPNLIPIEYQLARVLMFTRKWKLDRIPLVRRRIDKKWNESFPVKPRKLGRIPWVNESV